MTLHSEHSPIDEADSSLQFRDIAFIMVNAVGIVLYLLLASRGWRLPEEQDIPATGEPMVWSLALPVLGFFFLADVVWGGLLLRTGDLEGRQWWWVTVAAWLLAIAIDFSNH